MNFGLRLDEVLANLVNQVAANEQRLLNGNATRKATIDSDSHATTQAKQAITSLIKELVAEAKIDELKAVFVDFDERKLLTTGDTNTQLITFDQRIAKLTNNSESE